MKKLISIVLAAFLAGCEIDIASDDNESETITPGENGTVVIQHGDGTVETVIQPQDLDGEGSIQ